MLGHTYWDPIGDQIEEHTFKLQIQGLLDDVGYYHKHPYVIKRNQYICIAIAIAVSIIAYYFSDISRHWLQFTILGCVPLIIYRALIQSMRQNLILYLMCKNQGWVYNPNKDEVRYDNLKKYFPDIFDCGRSPIVEDQIWGSIEKKESTQFWTCAFTYSTGSGKSRREHDHTIFAIKLLKSLPASFTLFRRGFINFANSNYKTESEEFNKLFYIKAHNENAETKLQLMQVLSPSVQIRLIQLAKDFPLDGITFKKNAILIDFEDTIWQSRYTDFFKEVRVDNRDIQDFISIIDRMTEIPIEMLQFMD